ncbi:NusG domain II-containing protein [Nitrogeniibacter mangrovi]|uniref:NusG domain II-containing protein n=1 Tax=Nitrogeniibacter mangrovi TaxID=2016596 RepID=A0A6C1AYY0_9RHOO|nr:NusG domain II-containing protein [Nitrogeniibacter mangrovi]QID16571.1 NusG domain II-containing protein [Nitrogeniibacter mangrovi]
MRSAKWREWLGELRPGDGLVVLGGLAFAALAAWHLWQGGAARWAEVRAHGKVVARLPIDRPGTVTVDGPLGKTLIEVAPGRARVKSDPGPRQYCVRQGWLTHAGAVAICAPNQVSLHVLGDSPAYDTLNY